MIDKLGDYEFAGQTLTTENSYQYGPVCIDASLRGQGVLEGLFAFALEKCRSGLISGDLYQQGEPALLCRPHP